MRCENSVIPPMEGKYIVRKDLKGYSMIISLLENSKKKEVEIFFLHWDIIREIIYYIISLIMSPLPPSIREII
jgi:hypothetical protein